MTEGTGSCSVKKVFLRHIFAWEFAALWIVQSRGTLTKLGVLLKVFLLAWDIDVFWIIIWRANSKQPGKIRYCILVKIYIFLWDNMAFLCAISLPPEKKKEIFHSVSSPYLNESPRIVMQFNLINMFFCKQRLEQSYKIIDWQGFWD